LTESKELKAGGRTLLRKANLASLAHDEIKRRITVGRLKDGEKVVLGALAKEFGTSIIPIREALARLSAERLVIYEPNKGFRVAPAPDAEEIAHLFEARVVLELGALEVGMANVTPELVAELTALNDDIRSRSYGANFEAFESFIDLNARFHELLIGLTRNPLVIDAYQRLSYHERIPRLLHGSGVNDIKRIVVEHDAIIAALEARSLEHARSALRAHIVDAYDRLPQNWPGHSLRPLNASIPAR
jgi:DNA-binding GntR family transcriptional regulator